MSDLETKVKVTADTSGLREIESANKKAFDARAQREFIVQAKNLERDLARLTKTQGEMVRELLKVDRGTKAYKDLGRELRNVQRDADSVRRVMQDIATITSRGSERKQGFVAGMGQGLGVTQYLPTGPGMMPRMGGAMIGGALRRAGGAALSPFQSPGVGGFAGLLSAIPLVGPAAANALMAGSGMFQQATAFSGAKLQNMPYADLASRGATVVNPRYKKLQDSIIENETLIKRIDEVVRPQRVQESTDKMSMNNTVARISGMSGAGATGGRGRSRAAEGSAAAAARQAYTKRRGAILSRARGELKQAQEEIKTTSKTMTEDVTGIPGAGFGVDLGYAPEETQQFFGGMMGARGGQSDPDFLKRNVKEAMALNRMYGVSAELAGGFERMQMPGAGGVGRHGKFEIGVRQQSLAQATMTATAVGLSGSQIPEYLSMLVEQGKRMEQSGIKFDVANLTGTAKMLSAMGLEGLQAARVAKEANTAGSAVSARGVSSPAEMLLARAAGFDPSKGPGSYALAMEKIEEGIPPDVMQRLVSMVTSGAKANADDPSLQRRWVRQTFQRLKINMSSSQAGALLSGDEATTAKALDEIQTRAARPFDVSAAEAGVGRVGGLKRAQAGLQASQIAAGGNLAATYISLEKTGIVAVQTLGNFAKGLTSVTNGILDIMKSINAWTAGLSLIGVTK